MNQETKTRAFIRTGMLTTYEALIANLSNTNSSPNPSCDDSSFQKCASIVAFFYICSSQSDRVRSHLGYGNHQLYTGFLLFPLLLLSPSVLSFSRHDSRCLVFMVERIQMIHSRVCSCFLLDDCVGDLVEAVEHWRLLLVLEDWRGSFESEMSSTLRK